MDKHVDEQDDAANKDQELIFKGFEDNFDDYKSPTKKRKKVKKAPYDIKMFPA